MEARELWSPEALLIIQCILCLSIPRQWAMSPLDLEKSTLRQDKITLTFVLYGILHSLNFFWVT